MLGPCEYLCSRRGKAERLVTTEQQQQLPSPSCRWTQIVATKQPSNMQAATTSPTRPISKTKRTLLYIFTCLLDEGFVFGKSKRVNMRQKKGPLTPSESTQDMHHISPFPGSHILAEQSASCVATKARTGNSRHPMLGHPICVVPCTET